MASLRDPASLHFQRDTVRRLIVAAYWAVVALAVPIWWHITSIERLALPTARIQSTPPRIRLPLRVCIEHPSPALGQALLPRLQSESILPTLSQGAPCDASDDTYVVRFADSAPVIEGRSLVLPVSYAEKPIAFADTLEALLAPKRTTTTNHVAQYAPQYRLAFSLLNEDAAADPNAPIAWGVQDGLREYIQPTLSQLSPLHNFTIESQVQFHAPLAFSPVTLENGHGITPDDLTVFVNSEQWMLSSGSSNDPVLHFVLFIPSPTHRPLYILDKEGNPSPSNTFLLPQWGGIIIHNPPETSTTSEPHPLSLPHPTLQTTLASFSYLLKTLLGVPPLPPHIRSKSTSPLTAFQLDALLRQRTLETYASSRDTLVSLVSLVDKIENMPVREDVKGDVERALEGLVLASSPFPTSETNTNTTTSPLLTHFLQTSLSSTLASRAFFNPKMLALLYFPAEHKYAVYAPLFLSALTPLLVAALREWRSWKAEKKRMASLRDGAVKGDVKTTTTT